MSIMHWADTSALLHQSFNDPQVKIAISTITLQELEHIKNDKNESDQIKFKAREIIRSILTSSKFKAGFKDTMKFSDTSSLYAGLAYQYEAKGDAKGSLSAFNQSASIASPSLKGSTGIGEIGYTYETNSIKFDIGAKGYVRKERGYSGNLGVTFKF